MSGYAKRGRPEEGAKTYLVTGYIGASASTVVVVSEVANGSQARGWEVSLAIITQSENIQYHVQINDNHQALDQKYTNGNILKQDETEGIGNTNLGTFLVYANSAPEWGDLIWTITISSLDGKEIYIQFIMRWGSGTQPPLKIGGSSPSTDANQGGLNKQYSLLNLIWFAIITFFSIRRTKQKIDRNVYDAQSGGDAE